MQRFPGTGGSSLGHFLRLQAAAFSVGAAAIHFAEISPHIQEYWIFGAFFFVVAWFQAMSAITFVARPNRRSLLLAAAVNLVVIGIWVWSRTAGLPIGPEAGEPEPVGAADVLSTVLEAVLIGWVAASLVPRIAERGAPRFLGIVTTGMVWAGVVGATALVFFIGAGETIGH